MPDGEHLILIVDDNEISRMVIEHRVQKMGYQTVSVDSGKAALEYLQTEPVDLVLLDIIMADINGKQVLGHLRDIGRLDELPVIVVSGLDNQENMEECLAIGACDFVSKPINGDDLNEAIAMWMPGTDGSQLRKFFRHKESETEPLNSPVLDPAAIGQLQKDHDPGKAIDLIEKFESIAPRLYRQIIQASKSRAMDDWRRAAHELKGSARSLGLAQLAVSARNIEQACHLDQYSEALSETSKLNDYTSVGMAALKKYKDGLSTLPS